MEEKESLQEPRTASTLEKDTIALAAGTVTVALAANAAALGSSTSPEKVPRSMDVLFSEGFGSDSCQPCLDYCILCLSAFTGPKKDDNVSST